MLSDVSYDAVEWRGYMTCNIDDLVVAVVPDLHLHLHLCMGMGTISPTSLSRVADMGNPNQVLMPPYMPPYKRTRRLGSVPTWQRSSLRSSGSYHASGTRRMLAM